MFPYCIFALRGNVMVPSATENIGLHEQIGVSTRTHHHPAQKVTVVNTLVHLTNVVSDRDAWEDEKLHLHQALGRNR